MNMKSADAFVRSVLMLAHLLEMDNEETIGCLMIVRSRIANNMNISIKELYRRESGAMHEVMMGDGPCQTTRVNSD